VPKGLGDIYADLDTAAADHNFFPPGPGDIDDKLSPSDIGSKQGHNDAAMAIGNNFIQSLTDLLIGNCIPFFFHIGGIGQQGQHPFFTASGEFI